MSAIRTKGKRFFGTQLPGCDLTKLQGKLIVLEGADGSGRSTQIEMLKSWLENLGVATTSRSALALLEVNRVREAGGSRQGRRR